MTYWPKDCYICKEELPSSMWFIKGEPAHKECFKKELPDLYDTLIKRIDTRKK